MKKGHISVPVCTGLWHYGYAECHQWGLAKESMVSVLFIPSSHESTTLSIQ